MVLTLADLIIIVFIAGLSGHYVFVTIFVGFVATFGVLKTTNKDTKKDSHKPTDEEMTLGKIQKSETGTTVNIESEEVQENKRKDVEEGREDESTDRKSEDEEKPEELLVKTNLEENFLFTASVCSTWIPTVVGDQEQKIFLKAGIEISFKNHIAILFITFIHPGVTSLVTKTTFLAIALILAEFGIHTKHPFLLHCLDANSPLIDETDGSVTYCDFNETDTRWANCVLTEKDRNHTEKLAKFATTLEYLELAGSNHGGDDEWTIKSQLAKEFSKLQQIQNGTDKLTQKVRICGHHENIFRIWTLVILVVIITSAAFATIHLHRIADYEVGLS